MMQKNYSVAIARIGNSAFKGDVRSRFFPFCLSLQRETRSWIYRDKRLNLVVVTVIINLPFSTNPSSNTLKNHFWNAKMTSSKSSTRLKHAKSILHLKKYNNDLKIRFKANNSVVCVYLLVNITSKRGLI